MLLMSYTFEDGKLKQARNTISVNELLTSFFDFFHRKVFPAYFLFGVNEVEYEKVGHK